MPQNDPTNLEAVVAYLGAVLAAVTAWAWKHTHSLVRDKASAAEVVLLAASVKDKADASRVDKLIDSITHLVDTQRDESKRVYDAMEKIVDTHRTSTERMIAELGKRPTREECFVLHKMRQE